MTIPEADPARAAYECFLVEDVILTLGNLRGTLAWLGEAPDKARAGIDRLDRQLALLEDRARGMARHLRSGGPAEPANLFAEGGDPAEAAPREAEDQDSLSLAILRSLADETAGTAPVFRSRRA